MKGWLALLICLSCSPTAGAFDYLTSHGLGMGRTVMLSRSSASVLVSIPSGGLAPGEWSFESGYSRRFDLRDLDHIFSVAAVRYRSVTSAIGLQQFGRTDLYAERTMKWSLAVHLDSLSFGGTVSGMMADFGGGYGQLRAATVGAGVSYRSGRWYIAAVGDNLTSPALMERLVPLKPIYSIYGELIGKGSFSVTARATFQNRQDPQYALGQRIRLADGSAFFWGLSSNPIEFGGGIDLRLVGANFSYATSMHPVLGFSHILSVSYGSRPPAGQEDEFD